jgi:hypothetical protein
LVQLVSPKAFRLLPGEGSLARRDRATATPSDELAVRADPASPWTSPLTWRAHDRTHLELSVPFVFARDKANRRYEWQAYFFVPESFRMTEETYGKEALTSDFKGYMRLAVPDDPLGAFGGRLDELAAAIDRAKLDPDDERGDSGSAVFALRVFGCRVRRALLERLGEIEDGARSDRDRSRAAIERLNHEIAEVVDGFRALTAAIPQSTSELSVVRRWVDEDLSLLTETTLLRLRGLLADLGVDEDVHELVIARAVHEARYRRDEGYPAVADGKLNARTVERLEFRRHTLKRFTSSVLWLATEEASPGRWAKHFLYSVAAGVAMAFAVIAALWNGPPDTAELSIWLVVAVFAYAVKDRIKAGLQDAFSRVMREWLPDRRWRIRDRKRDVVVATIDERSSFESFDRVPAPVLEVRRSTREHPIEEQARPETVLSHRKNVTIHSRAVEPGFSELREIFRVDLGRWLANTDDPKNRIMFADPVRGGVKAVVAPRVYNIGIVYRLRDMDHDEADAWHRVRVVVTRKGIRRVDPIS